MKTKKPQQYSRKGKKSRYYEESRLFRRKEVYEAFKNKYPKVTQSPEELRQMFYDVLDTTANFLIEQEDGVLMEGLGYFAGTVYDQKRKVIPSHTGTITNFATGGEVYKFEIFGSMFRNRRYRFWSFRLHREKARRVKDLVHKGLRYKNRFHFLRSLKNNGQKYFLRKPYS